MPPLDEPCFIIAEAGVNHNGNPELAHRMIAAAALAKADAVKFQTFQANQLVTAKAEQAAYQRRNTQQQQSQHHMLSALQFPYEVFTDLAASAKSSGIEFLSTPFDIESARFLVEDVGLTTLKIGSGDLTNAPFLFEIAKLGQKIILSTGMADLPEITAAMDIIAAGLSEPELSPSKPADLANYAATPKGQQALRDKVTLLHCTTEYPAPPDTANLKAMKTLSDTFGLDVGFSDHTQGIHFAAAAVALGAKVIEKHFTLDRALPGPDHKASIEPEELARMIRDIREIEVGLGTGVKMPTEQELKNRVPARRSIVSATAIGKGEEFTTENLTTKRPGGHLSPLLWWQYLGQTATRDYKADEPIDP